MSKFNNLDAFEASGDDGVPNSSNINAESVAKSWTFTKFEQTFFFFDQGKIAYNIPTFKNGIRELPSNYRPVALLSCISKVYGRCIHGQLLPIVLQILITAQYNSGRGLLCHSMTRVFEPKKTAALPIM